MCTKEREIAEERVGLNVLEREMERGVCVRQATHVSAKWTDVVS